jgi:magnesium transporter
MLKFNRKRIKKVGLPPGTPVYVGERKDEKINISIIDYDIDGIHEVNMIEKIGKHFDLHPLIMEDIVNTEQRPKMEDFGHYVYVVLRMLYFDEEAHEVKGEQVSLILGENFVISFQEKEGDIFNPIRERIRNHKGRIRKMGADYLAYCLLDTIVDNYFTILEKLGDRIEEMEERLVTDPRPKTLHEIHKLKREMIFLRKSVWPLREVINGLERGESSLIHKASSIYLRDVYDHTIQVIDTVETFRDMLSGMHDTYLSSISNRMNEIMKVLTIIATIFIPLTFIAGVYGMNFKFMPELEWRWAYFIVWLVIVIVAVSMVIFFRKKKWL